MRAAKLRTWRWRRARLIAALLLNKFPNKSRAKSFIAQNGFIIEIYFAQKWHTPSREESPPLNNERSDIFPCRRPRLSRYSRKDFERTKGGICYKCCSGCRNEWLNHATGLLKPVSAFIALKTTRGFKSGLPVNFGGGNSGSIISCCAFVRQ